MNYINSVSAVMDVSTRMIEECDQQIELWRQRRVEMQRCLKSLERMREKFASSPMKCPKNSARPRTEVEEGT